MGKETDIHGLAATIRSATSSETFDLGGLPSTTITQVVRDAFSKDFSLDDGDDGGDRVGMIRITLIVGAGKGNRAKYDPSALKLVTTALTAAGYLDDRGASCVVESAGCFKFQHDTGKNLKTVVVFPKLRKNARDDGDDSTTGVKSSSSLLPPDSLEFKIAVSDILLFRNMLQHKFISWSQKRSLLMLIDETLVGPLNKLDAALVKGRRLSEDETIFYEQCVSVSEKKGFVKDAMSQQVQEGKLTASETSFLLEQLATRTQELKLNGKPIPDALMERERKLLSIAKNPIPPPPLKYHTALGKLWKQAAPLMYLKADGGGSGRLLSPAETKKLGQLEDLLSEIADLEESSRGLLEDDGSYQERIELYRRALQQRFGNIGAKSKNQQKQRAVGGPSSKGMGTSHNYTWNSTATTKFYTPNVGSGKVGQNSRKAKKSKLGSNGGGLFGAMMATSDSDSESDEGEFETSRNRMDTRPSPSSTTTPTAEPPPTGDTNKSGCTSKKQRKKKKAKNKPKGGYQGSDDALLDAAVAANNSGKKDQKDKTADGDSNIFKFLWLILTEWIIPFFMAILTWIVALFFGKGKTKKKKRS